MNHKNYEEEGGKGLPILLAIVAILVIVWMATRGLDPETSTNTVKCQDSLPSRNSGQCSTEQELVVVGGVALCRCR